MSRAPRRCCTVFTEPSLVKMAFIVVSYRCIVGKVTALCWSSTSEDPLFWEISIFQYINRKKWKIFEILTNWKFWSKTALPAFLQKLYIYSIMSARLTLALSKNFSKKNTWKYFCSNILHIIYIIFFDFFLRWKTSRV